MTRRALIVSDARPSHTGATSWRRFCMLTEVLRGFGLGVDAIVVRSGDETPADTRALLGEVGDLQIVASGDLDWWIGRAMRRRDYQSVVLTSPALGQHAAHSAKLRIVDMQSPGGSFDQDSGADLILTGDKKSADLAAEMGCNVLEAPFFGAGVRKQRPALKKQRPLAGCWVEQSHEAVEAVRRLFSKIEERGGGGCPNFALAGPGAGAVHPPRLPFPVSLMPPDTDERVFYRGLDLAMVPCLEEGAPRLDVVSALEHGATPLASSAALGGLRRRWRLPHFGRLDQMADFLFERGGEMRDGGLLVELRARADWTWSGLVTAAARTRVKLGRQLMT